MKALHITSLRAKLFLAAIAVQVLMLVALTTQSLDFLNAKLEERAQLRLDEEKSLLVTSLADPVKRRDLAAIERVLSSVRSAEGIAYVILLDNSGKAIASSGWDAAMALPSPGAALHGDAGARRGRFDTEVVIQ